MAWNQPGNNGQDRDPWGSSKPGGNSEGNGNKGGRDQGPPDLDDILAVVSLPSQRQRLSLSGRPVVSIPLKKPNAAW